MNSQLKKLESLLEGYNYTVFLRAYTAEHEPSADLETIVHSAVSEKLVVGKAIEDSPDEVLSEISASIGYRGDDAHGPKRAVLDSRKFVDLKESVEAWSRELAENSESVHTFGILDGHPAYPVFWDFAFLFRGPTQSTIFIGSSSD